MSYGGWPASMWKSVAPSDHTSEASFARWPAATSGARYAGDPVTMPVWVSEGSLVIRAMPKSVSFAKPRRSTSTFDGFTSRCTMPAACAAASASATCCITSAASSTGMRPCLFTSWVMVLPSTYSITSQWWPVSTSTTRSKTATT